MSANLLLKTYYLLSFPNNPEKKISKSSGYYFYPHVDMTMPMIDIILLKYVYTPYKRNI